MSREYRRKSQLALGIAVICLLFIVETWSADRQAPNAASPFIWGVLGVVALASLALAWWFSRKARQS